MGYFIQGIRIPFYVTMVLAFLGKFIFELNIVIAVVAIVLIGANLAFYKKVEIDKVSLRGIKFCIFALIFWIAYIGIGNEINSFILVENRLLYFQYGVISILNMVVLLLYGIYDKSLKKQMTIIVFLVISFLIFMVGIELISEFKLDSSRLPRIKGFDKNPNLTGLKLNILLFTLYSLVKNNKKYKIIFLITDVLVGSSIIFTMSRGSLIIFTIIQGIIFYEISKKSKKDIFLLLLMLSIGFIVSFMFIDNFNLRFERLSLGGWGDGDYSNGRMNLLLSGINIFMRNPLFGVGLGNSPYYGVLYGISEQALMPHNTIVYIMAETGIIPISILLISIISLFRKTIREKNNDVGKLIFILFVASFFNHNIHLFPTVYISLFTLLIFNEREDEIV